MLGAGEHIHRLQTVDPVAFFAEDGRIPGSGGAVAGDHDHPFGRHLGDGVKQRGFAAFAGRVENDDVGAKSLGGKTAVANNDQIVEGISIGVYKAVMAAKAQGGEGGSFNFYLDGDPIYAKVEKNRRESGMQIYSGGVV